MILRYVSHLPSFARVSKMHYRISMSIYVEFLKAMNSTYPEWKDIKMIPHKVRRYLNLIALIGDWDSFCVMMKRNPIAGIHMCHAFMRWDISRRYVHMVKIDHHDTQMMKPLIYLLWYMNHPRKKEITRRILLFAEKDSGSWTGYLTKEIIEFILQDEVLVIYIKTLVPGENNLVSLCFPDGFDGKVYVYCTSSTCKICRLKDERERLSRIYPNYTDAQMLPKMSPELIHRLESAHSCDLSALIFRDSIVITHDMIEYLQKCNPACLDLAELDICHYHHDQLDEEDR